MCISLSLTHSLVDFDSILKPFPTRSFFEASSLIGGGQHSFTRDIGINVVTPEH